MAKRKRNTIEKDGKIYVEKNKRSGCLKWGLIALGVIIVAGLFGNPNGDKNNDKQNLTNESSSEIIENSSSEESVSSSDSVESESEEYSYTPPTPEEEESMRQAELEETDWKQVTWEDLMRTDDYLFDTVEVNGEVLVVQNSGDSTIIQLMKDGDSDAPVIIEVLNEYLDKKVLEGDWINAKGTYMQVTEYQTVLGANKQAPHIVADFITIQ